MCSSHEIKCIFRHALRIVRVFLPSLLIQIFIFETSAKGGKFVAVYSMHSNVKYIAFCIFIRREKRNEKSPHSRIHLLSSLGWFSALQVVFGWAGTDNAHQAHGEIVLILRLVLGPLSGRGLFRCPDSRTTDCNRRSHCAADCRHVHCVSGDADGFYRRLHCHNANTSSRCCDRYSHSLDFFNFILSSFSVVPDNRFHSHTLFLNASFSLYFSFAIATSLSEKWLLLCTLNIAYKWCSICICSAYYPYYTLLFPFGNAAEFATDGMRCDGDRSIKCSTNKAHLSRKHFRSRFERIWTWSTESDSIIPSHRIVYAIMLAIRLYIYVFELSYISFQFQWMSYDEDSLFSHAQMT